MTTQALTKDTFDIVTLFTNINFLVFVVFCILFTAVTLTIWMWHHDKNNSFNLQQVLIDSSTGKIAIEKVGFITSLAIGSFGFVALLFMGDLSEWYAGLYMGTFAVARLGSTWLTIKRDLQEVFSADK